MIATNAPIYIALLAGLIFTCISLIRSKALPHLAEFMSVALSAAAAHGAVILSYEVLQGTKKLGDFQDQKLTIILGSVAVIWVAALTIIQLVQRIPAGKGATGSSQAQAREESA